MLELFSSGLLSLWLETNGISSPNAADLQQVQYLLSASPSQPQFSDSGTADRVIQGYLNTLADRGFTVSGQGVWLQAGDQPLASHQGQVPLSAASLTKVATTLAALATWGPDHRFDTLIGATGPIQNGVLRGDLIIQGRGDPFFVWEEAVALGNTLHRIGIQRVSGNLVITGSFAMNFESDPFRAGEFLKQGLNEKLWPPEAETYYNTLPEDTPRPQIQIDGSVQFETSDTAISRVSGVLVRHQSLPLVEILRQMNIYSNNYIADMLAEDLGGPLVMAQRVAQLGNFPPEEIQLINGSGLGEENQISPRAVVDMLTAIHQFLEPYNLTITDAFPVSGRDRGTISSRKIPRAAAVKTGTLNYVSALAGVLPTEDQGLVWFSIQNRGGDLLEFRAQQDIFLQELRQAWGEDTAADPKVSFGELGDMNRNQIY